MNVLMLGKFSLQFRGGIEQVSLRWFNMYKENKRLFKEVVYLGHRTATDSFEMESEVLKDVQFFCGTQPISIMYVIYFISNYFRFGLIHAHFPNAVAAFLCCIARPKSAIQIHWHADLLGKSKTISLVYELLAYFACWRASTIIVTSPDYAKYSPVLKKFSKKICICPLTTKSVEPSKKDTDPTLLLSVGRLVNYKGWFELLESFAKVESTCKLVIVGDGPLKLQLTDRINNLRLESRVEILSNINSDQLSGLYEEAYAFILNSTTRAEAFGVVLIEAAAHGLPLLSTHLPGSGMMFVNKHGESGLVHDPNESMQLVENITKILSDKNFRDKLSKGSKQRFEKYFSDERLDDYFLESIVHLEAPD